MVSEASCRLSLQDCIIRHGGERADRNAQEGHVGQGFAA